MQHKLLSAVLAMLVLSVTVVGPASSATAQEGVTGTCTIETATGDLTGTFTGTFEPIRLVYESGEAFVRGTLEGTCEAVDGLGNTVTRTVDEVLNVPITGAQANDACTILDLTLGPIHLDLLGLVVDVSQIDIDITAVPGAGNLLGNLLCEVAGLLDGGTGNLIRGVVQLLNRLLGQGLLTF